MSKLEEILVSDQQPKGLDFVELYREGILELQKLSGAFWTDFNVHDPGVTALEQLCLSLVDLYFRSSLDVENILLSNKRQINVFKPEDILPCNALTGKDIRKCLIHDIPDLNNVWVMPVLQEESSFKGIYDLWLDPISHDLNEEDVNTLTDKVKKVFCSNRNLCEDLANVRILRPMEIQVNASVQVDDSRTVEDIYAEILFNIDSFLRPSVSIHPFDQVHDKLPPEKLFEGPALKHGFVKDEELTEKPTRILISDLIKIILDVDGVASVKKIQLLHDSRIHEDQITIPRECIPHLKNMETKSTSEGIVMSSVNFSWLDVNNEILQRKLNVLKAGTGRLLRLKGIKKEESEELWNIEKYSSLQNDMPELYGIGQLGLRNSDTPKRKAAARQLKAYLLLFEQIMANYLSQLANITSLFSYPIDNKSYFWQKLEDIPRIDEVKMKKEGVFIQHPLFAGYQIPQNYKEGLPKLLLKFDDFIERQNRFMDFLLAVNGETFPEKALEHTNTYYSPREFKFQLLKFKQRLLYSLTEINGNRAKAYDYLSPDSQKDISGLQIKAAVMLGFESHFEEKLKDGFREPYVADSFLNYGLELVPEGKMPEIEKELNEEIEKNIDSDAFDYVDADDFDQHTFTEAELKEILGKTTLFETNEIYPELFKEGPELLNYLVGKIQNKFVLVFRKRGNKQWHFMGTFENYDAAALTALAFVYFFKQIGIKGEGMYLIEHILLRPRLTLKRFGFYLHDENLSPLLFSTSLYTYNDRVNVLKQVKEEIYNFDNYRVEECGEGLFEIIFETSDKEVKLISINKYKSVEEIYALMEKAFLFLSDKYEIITFEQKHSLFVKYTKPKERIPEDFFSYRVSVIFPDWTNRFANKEFRQLAERLIRKMAPAYVSLDFYWLSPKKIKRFEHSYLMWKEGFLRLEKPEDNVMNKNMVRYIFEYKNEQND